MPKPSTRSSGCAASRNTGRSGGGGRDIGCPDPSRARTAANRMTDARSILQPSGAGPALGFVAPAASADVAELEAEGAASFWVGGHIASPNPTPEAMVWLARLVEQTRHVVV